jgi:integrase
VWRKNKRQQASVPVPPAARDWLDRYLDDEQRGRGRDPGPLFVSARSGNRRLDRRDVQRMLARVARQASTQLPDAERMHLHPHQLRHTFLKRHVEKHGVVAAQAASGNVSTKEIFRYAAPSQTELEEQAADLF